MPTDRDPLDLDERTARLGRDLFAEVRRRQQQEEAAEKRRSSPTAGDTSDDAGLLDWLFGDGDGDCDAGD